MSALTGSERSGGAHATGPGGDWRLCEPAERALLDAMWRMCSMARSWPGMRCGWRVGWLTAVLLGLPPSGSLAAAPVTPVVEVEEDVYTYEDARNGADPLWGVGATCLVRWEDRLFASGLQTMPGIPPGNNCRWLLFGREPDGSSSPTGPTPWRQVRSEVLGLTREPCPLALSQRGALVLSSCQSAQAGGAGAPRLQFIEFAVTNIAGPRFTLAPDWGGYTNFTDSTYRSLAADGPRGELVLFVNGGPWSARWLLLNERGAGIATGELRWPWEGGYERAGAVRITHANTLLRDGVLHFCGISELTEPVSAWRDFKRQPAGNGPDLVSRRLFYVRAPDLVRGLFDQWIEVANLDKTAGTITLGDLWVDREEVVHVVWAEEALDERLRARFFPQAPQTHTINYARLRRDTILTRRTLVPDPMPNAGEVPSRPRFQITPDQQLFVFYFVSGVGADGRTVAENRVIEVQPDGSATAPVKVPLAHPMDRYYTATPRAGSPLSTTLDLLGSRAGVPFTVSYARVQLRDRGGGSNGRVSNSSRVRVSSTSSSSTGGAMTATGADAPK